MGFLNHNQIGEGSDLILENLPILEGLTLNGNDLSDIPQLGNFLV